LKNNNWEAEFIQLEKTIGEELRKLPPVNPDEEFKERLKQGMYSKMPPTPKRRPRPRANRRPWFRVGALAAGLLLALVLARFSLAPEPDPNTPSIGPFLVPTVQASPGGSSGFLSSAGLDQVRQVEFMVQGELPSLPDKATALKYTDSSWTMNEVLELATNLGLKNPKRLGEEPSPALGPTFIEADNGRLYVWLGPSNWLLETDQQLITTDKIDESSAEHAVSRWLQQAGLFPLEKNLQVQVQPSDDGFSTGWEVTIRPISGPEGKPIMGRGPEISAMVSSDGQLLSVSYIWPEEGKEIELPLADFEQALDALARGEGSFEVADYRPFEQGRAVVTEAEQGYQLVYPLDDAPYLIPVAIFRGQHVVGESTADFTAWVSLLPPYTNENSGNFLLETQLPPHKKTLSLLRERDRSVSEAELPIIAAHFGLNPNNWEDDEIVGDGQTLSATSWDGGWMYRGPGLLKGQRKAEEKLPPEKALALATDVVRRLPNLPGQVGAGQVLPGADNDSYTYVKFPLLYEGQPVATCNSPGHISNVSVQLGPDGAVWFVHLAHPMEALPEEAELISPEEAWERLQQNDFLISLDEGWGLLPGDRFAAAYSRIEKVELVYWPRYYQVIRNEHYHIKYAFSGTTQIGDRQMRFTALVDAVH
jgi:hypothetical protein